ncbi:leucine-rich repeat protein [Eubacterium pyruvativorans]|uniref:leucine-rich repeat protein n=1 Tax=Eubacterium pyruvativorans TaxID=155865 RepID=UPI000B847EB8
MPRSKIKAGKGLERTEDFAFRGCENLKEIRMPEGVQTVHKGMFRECKKSEKIYLIIPGSSEPPVRTLRATIPENESH